MSGLKENDMSKGEVLAAVNKIHNQKSRTLKTFPSFPVTTKFFNTCLIFKVASNKENKVDDTRPRCA
jgi:hypothetical protein